MMLSPLSERRNARPSDGAPDVRGWTVVTLVDDERVGHVHDLLLDAGGEVRYLDVDLGAFRKHVLVPIGQARADRARNAVLLPGFTRERLAHVPAWDHRAAGPGRAYEHALVRAYTRAFAGEAYRPRPPYAGAVYGPSELESPVRVEAGPALALLSRLPDHRVAASEPDPRGWTLVVADGTRAGRVEDLLVDTRVLKVRSLVVRLTFDPEDGSVLVPVEYVRLDARGRTVWVDVHTPDALRELPAWTGPTAGARAADGPPAGPPDFYDHPRFSTRRFSGGTDA